MRIQILRIALLVGAWALSLPVWSEEEAAAGAICGPLLPVPAAVARMDQLLVEPGPLDRAAVSASLSQDPEVAAYNQAQRAQAALDWPRLCRYQADNARLLAAGTRPDMVFLGDSITEYWAKADAALFAEGGRLVNRGISGQTSAQMLLRFHADVVALKPKRVHILAGTNDVAGNQGPVSLQMFRDNITAMVEMARANGIAVTLGSIPPAARIFWKPELVPAPRIAQFNAWLQAYATEQKLGFVDYHAALLGSAGDGGIASALANDGVHPNRDGYAVMKRALLPALDTAR